MKERPILFSGDMVRAILDGSKTMTRRVVKPQPVFDSLSYSIVGPEKSKWAALVGVYLPNTNDFIHRALLFCPYGQPGDRLWVRETWAIRDCKPLLAAIFRADAVKDDSGERDGWWLDKNRNGDEVFIPGKIAWKPSIFMPRWASRITLEITAVRVERLQEIDEIDDFGQHLSDEAWAEGFRTPNPTAAFMLYWDSLNAKRGYGWEANPWVWVISFKKT